MRHRRMKECPNNLFAYGTLMCADIMQDVSGCSLSCVPGILTGYSRRPVKGELYPGLVQHSEGRVEGPVYLNVPDWAWERLDRFEGEMYTRQIAQIDLNDGSTLPAAAYVVQPEFLGCLDPCDWDFAKFLDHSKADFLRQYRG